MAAKILMPRSIIGLISILLILTSCGRIQPTELPDITGRWIVDHAVHLPSGEQIPGEEGEFISFSNSEGQIFRAESNLLGLFTSGSWELRTDSLILRTIDSELTIVVDSVIYRLIDGSTQLIYYSQGEVIATQSSQELTSPEQLMIFTIEQYSVQNMTISRADYSYYLEFKAVEAVIPPVFSLYNLFRGLLGMLALIAIAWLFSSNRKAVSWRIVGIGLSIQLLLAFGILQVPFIQYFFEIIGSFFVIILDFTKAGTEFLFGGFLDVQTYGFIFAFQVLPTIIFFSALTSLLFYLGIIQKIVYGLAWMMTKAMRISGAESLSVAGNIFLGQTESPLMIKAYLERMNRSEILLVMTGGMATMAGGVLAAYISFLGGDDPVQRLIFAKHLLAASIMAAPGAVVISKILLPQTEPIDQKVEVSKERIGNNILDSISNGTTEGLKLAANVAAMLLVFIAFIAMFNYIAGWVGAATNLNPLIAEATGGQFQGLSLQFILGYAFAPVMWVIGIATPDITLAGRLLGEKVILTEFIGYLSLAELKAANAFTDPRSVIMSTYLLCGFANFASIGIQIGGIGSLAPGKRVLLSQFGMRALLGGTLAALMSATMVGIILG
jgi:concentrative nucleoside transporter, CNT family